MKPLFPWRWMALAYLAVFHTLFMLSVGDVVEGPRTYTAVGAFKATAVLLIGMLLGWLATKAVGVRNDVPDSICRRDSRSNRSREHRNAQAH